MTTVEKLFVQIFERKNWIIDQVKQQTDLYSQHLASKCLIQGITPPPWLWNPNFRSSSSSDFRDLNKEELLSELLLPHPRPTVPYFTSHYSLYNKPVVKGDNEELSDGKFMETNASNRGHHTGEPGNMLEHHNDYSGSVSKGVSELDVNVCSPQDQTDVRISNIYSAPDQSLARIQRSKSRQKALELRNSAKAILKSHLSQEDNDGVSFSGNTLLNDASQPVSHVDEPSCGSENNLVGQVKERNPQQKDRSTSTYCGRVTRSRSKNRSFQLGDSSNVANRDISMSLQSTNKLVKYSSNVCGLLESGIESCGLTEARQGIFQKEKSHNVYSGRITRSRSSSQQHKYSNESPKQVAFLFSANAGGEEIAQPICKSLPQLNGGNMLLGLVESSDEPLNRRIYSETTSGKERMPKPLDTSGGVGYGVTQSKSGITRRSSLQDSPNRMEICTSKDEPARNANPPSDHIHEIVVNQEVNAHSMVDTEFVSNRPVECANLQVGLTGVVLRSPSDNYMFVKPKQLDFDNLEECKAITTLSPTSTNNKLDILSETIDYTVPVPSSSVDEIAIQSSTPRLLEKQSPTVREALTEAENLERRSFGETVLNIGECPRSKSADDNNKALRNILESPILQVEKSLSLTVDNHPDAMMHQEQGHFTGECGWQVQEGVNGSERRNGSASTSDTLEHTPELPSWTKQATVDAKYLLVREVISADLSSIVPDSTRQSFVQDDHDLLRFEDNLNNEMVDELACAGKELKEEMFESGEDRIFERGTTGTPSVNENPCCIKSMELKVDSCPQSKRRKIEYPSINCFSASTSYQGPNNEYLKSVEDNLDAYLKLFPAAIEANVSGTTVKNSQVVEIHQNTNEGTDFSKDVQIDMGEACKEIKRSSTFSHKDFEPNFVSNWTEQEVVNSQEVGTTDQNSRMLDLRNTWNKEDIQHLLHDEKKVDLMHSSDLTCKESSSQASTSLAPHKSLVDIIGPDQTMPVSEGFIIDAHSEDKQPGAVGDGIDFGRLDLSSNTIERACVMEQICKSASLCTPLSSFSTFKLHRTQDVYQSAPNGLLEHMDLKSALALDDNIGKQLRASYGCEDEINRAFQEAAFSEYLPYANARYGWNSRNTYMSPVGKLWEKNSNRTGSSENKMSLNPELTCFPIEEDPNISEDQENEDVLTDKTPVKIGSSAVNSFASREPLADIAVACSNAPADVFPDRSSLDSLNTEISFRGTKNWANQNFGNDFSNNRRWTNEAKENQSLSFGKQGIKSLKEVNRVSRPKLSGKSSLMKAVHRQSEKESKPNNIVSNIASFIPLVQKKQAAAVSTGKRNIKVKALKAAEAAKRLAEQRENERRMKKEEAKLERARLEQENMRQMELKKKKKEEEQKKKEADMVAKKRQREEEERKEKERKRIRFEETRRQQKELEGKLRVGKSDKQKRPDTGDDTCNKKKEFSDESEKHQKIEDNGYNIVLEKPETQLMRTGGSTSSGNSTNIAEDLGYSGKAALVKLPKDDDLVAKTIQENSYEISPYQCSDGEDDEEDDLPTKKFIPSWASKSCVALALSAQQRIDPDVIFPRESFCSIDEVLLTRKLQPK